MQAILIMAHRDIGQVKELAAVCAEALRCIYILIRSLQCPERTCRYSRNGGLYFSGNKC